MKLRTTDSVLSADCRIRFYDVSECTAPMNLYKFINLTIAIIRSVNLGKSGLFLFEQNVCTVENRHGSTHSFSTFAQKGLSGETVHCFSTDPFRQFPHKGYSVEKKGEKAAAGR